MVRWARSRGKIRRRQSRGQDKESGSPCLEGTVSPNTGNTQPHAAQKTTKTVVTGGVSEAETEKKKGQRDEPQRVVPTEHQKPRGQNQIVNTHQPGHTGKGRGEGCGEDQGVLGEGLKHGEAAQ